jgi:hypothetical protein
MSQEALAQPKPELQIPDINFDSWNFIRIYWRRIATVALVPLVAFLLTQIDIKDKSSDNELDNKTNPGEFTLVYVEKSFTNHFEIEEFLRSQYPDADDELIAALIQAVADQNHSQIVNGFIYLPWDRENVLKIPILK